jgi:hypothetical protein
MVEADTALAPARSAARWSWRKTASTSSAIRAAGSLRHREPIFAMWARSRSAQYSMVRMDSGRRTW